MTVFGNIAFNARCNPSGIAVVDLCEHLAAKGSRDRQRERGLGNPAKATVQASARRVTFAMIAAK
jgi:hypothetical protein